MATSVGSYLRDNYWVWVVVGVVVLLITVAISITCCLCCLHRHRKRRRGVYYVNLRSNIDNSLHYGSMELQRSLNTQSFSNPSFSPAATVTVKRGEEGVAEAWNNQRRRRESSEREAALLTCQYYLRNSASYSLVNPLPDLGSRVAKYWFLITPNGLTGQSSATKPEMIMTLLPASKQCPIKFQKETLKTLNELLATLKHPYLCSVEHVDYLPEQSSVVMAMTFFPQGSLKDVIYKRQPTFEWSEKYSIRRRGLPPEMVALYGRQILEALRVLYRKGFPPLGNLQSGNIFVDRKICRLSGYENTLLGYRSRHYRLVKVHPDAMDTIMFGHLLFEMMCGYELTTLLPSNTDLGNVKSEEQVEVLKYVFGGATDESASFPNIVEVQLCRDIIECICGVEFLFQVLDLPFFKSVHLPEIENWDSSQIQLSSEMKALLRGVRKGRSDSLREQSSSRRRTFTAQEN
jgi:PX domain-containing protein kinase-like protein